MSDLNKLKDIYTHVKNQANSLRGQSSKYSEITGLCPVNTVELQAGSILDLIDQLESAQQRIAELEAKESSLLESLKVTSAGANREHSRRIELEAELARRDAAALPPEVAYVDAPDHLARDEAFEWTAGANWMREQAKALGCKPEKVVALPPSMDMLWRTTFGSPYATCDAVAINAVTAALDAAGVKWMRDQAIALGCKAIKLPKINHPAQFDYAERLTEELKAQGFTVEGE